jgi:hypothetical protein
MRLYIFLLRTILVVLVSGTSLNAQSIEGKRAETIKAFCNYLIKTDSSQIRAEDVIKSYVDAEYIQPDTNVMRYRARLNYLRTFTKGLQSYVHSLSNSTHTLIPLKDATNVDSKLLERFKEMPFEVYAWTTTVNGRPNKVWLAFRPGEWKVASWTLIDQGGYKYFLTLNLVGNTTAHRK